MHHIKTTIHPDPHLGTGGEGGGGGGTGDIDGGSG